MILQDVLPSSARSSISSGGYSCFQTVKSTLDAVSEQGTYLFNTIVADQAGNAATYNVTILSSSALSSFNKLSLYMCLWAGIAALTLLSGLW